ncbi:MAG: hypothetical protein KKD86_08190 [Bacteroidetes bacterium]|nr:hypothetical protein [Bacteroidota bacterium]
MDSVSYTRIKLLCRLAEAAHIILVAATILIGAKRRIGVNESGWLIVEKVKDIKKIKLLYELEKGEAEVIVLAIEKGISHVLVDEKIALQLKLT